MTSLVTVKAVHRSEVVCRQETGSREKIARNNCGSTGPASTRVIKLAPATLVHQLALRVHLFHMAERMSPLLFRLGSFYCHQQFPKEEKNFVYYSCKSSSYRKKVTFINLFQAHFFSCFLLCLKKYSCSELTV